MGPQIEQAQAEKNGISPETELEVLKQARQVGAALENPAENTVAMIGGCAMTDQESELLAENQRIADIAGHGLLTLHRIPVWKPRTDPEKDWEGLETNQVDIRGGKGYKVEGTQKEGAEAASRILRALTIQNPISTIEIGKEEHIDRYGRMLAAGWSGSRNAKNKEYIIRLAHRDPMTPLFVKNGIDGSIDSAVEIAKEAASERKTVEGSAPVIVIFRGGDELETPEKWEKAYIEALEATDGRLIVDVAHGSEMAFDPSGGFKKSAIGQIAVMNTVIRLIDSNHIPAGMMIEASDLESPTDPVMPLQTALDGVKRFHEAKLRKLEENNARKSSRAKV